MPTINQLCRGDIHGSGGRVRKVTKVKYPELAGSPQRKGRVVSVFTMTPCKPNSALRPVARVLLSSGFTVIAHIPGIGHNIQEHAVVLVKAGGPPDLAGVWFRVVRGVLDAAGVSTQRKRRSSLGASRPK